MEEGVWSIGLFYNIAFEQMDYVMPIVELGDFDCVVINAFAWRKVQKAVTLLCRIIATV